MSDLNLEGTFVKRKNGGAGPNSVGSFSVSAKSVNKGKAIKSAGPQINRFRCLTLAGEKDREVCF